MSYATLADLEERYGHEEILLVGDRDHDGEIDEAVVDRALQDAADEIDAHISTRYALPLPHTPPILRRLALRHGALLPFQRCGFPHGGEGQPLRSRREDAQSSSPGARPSWACPKRRCPRPRPARRWMRAARTSPAGEGCEEVRSLKFEIRNLR